MNPLIESHEPSPEFRARLEWQIATVKAIRQETPRVKTFTLALPDWVAHRPGQHYDLRLSAPDGYRAQRSDSIGSEPERAGEIDLTIERGRVLLVVYATQFHGQHWLRHLKFIIFVEHVFKLGLKPLHTINIAVIVVHHVLLREGVTQEFLDVP